MRHRQRERGGKDKAKEGGWQPGEPEPAIAIRSNFNPLAAFAPSVKTDGQGRATVSVKMPDNLTRYRIVAIATAAMPAPHAGVKRRLTSAPRR